MGGEAVRLDAAEHLVAGQGPAIPTTVSSHAAADPAGLMEMSRRRPGSMPSSAREDLRESGHVLRPRGFNPFDPVAFDREEGHLLVQAAGRAVPQAFRTTTCQVSCDLAASISEPSPNRASGSAYLTPSIIRYALLAASMFTRSSKYMATTPVEENDRMARKPSFALRASNSACPVRGAADPLAS